jgi:2-oxoglutarate dehydrogenase E1 component
MEKFKPVISDAPRGAVRRVNLCAGKIYYDLHAKRQQLARADVALVRVEQLYPLPQEALREALSSFPAETPVFWVQEEPENMGAWSYLNLVFRGRLFGDYPFSVVCRPRSASPAHGSRRSHRTEQERLLTQALSEP